MPYRVQRYTPGYTKLSKLRFFLLPHIKSIFIVHLFLGKMSVKRLFDELLHCFMFCPQLPSQYSAAPAPKPSAPPPTAPKPALSFLPPPEMGDRPPPAPWAEELKARTNRQANHNNSAPSSAAQPFAKGPAVAPKSAFGGRTATSSASLAQKLNQNLNQTTAPVAPKPSPPSTISSFPLPPAAPPAPPTPPSNMGAAPSSNHIKSSPFASQVNANQNAAAAVPPPQPKTMASPSSSFSQPMKSPPASTVCCRFNQLTWRLTLHCFCSIRAKRISMSYFVRKQKYVLCFEDKLFSKKMLYRSCWKQPCK